MLTILSDTLSHVCVTIPLWTKYHHPHFTGARSENSCPDILLVPELELEPAYTYGLSGWLENKDTEMFQVPSFPHVAISTVVNGYRNSTCNHCLCALPVLPFFEKSRWKTIIRDKNRCYHIYWACTISNSSDKGGKKKGGMERKGGNKERKREGEESPRLQKW